MTDHHSTAATQIKEAGRTWMKHFATSAMRLWHWAFKICDGYCQSVSYDFSKGRINDFTTVQYALLWKGQSPQAASPAHWSKVDMKKRSVHKTLWTTLTGGDVFAWATFSFGTYFWCYSMLAKLGHLTNIISLVNCVNMKLQRFSVIVLTCLKRKFNAEKAAAFVNKIREGHAFAGLLSEHELTPGTAAKDMIIQSRTLFH